MSTAQILIQQGKEEGLQTGLQLGKEEGREEEKILLAKKMKEEGADEIFISRVTGISLDELKTIL